MKSRIVLLGPPASGKGTLAEALHASYGWPVASPGAMLRAEKAAGTRLGIEADQLTREGRLVGDEIINQVVELWLSGEVLHGFIFDGYPRTIRQAEALEQMLSARKTQLDVALLLDASISTLRARVEARQTCTQCGYISRIEVAGAQCPKCGGAWGRRTDDTAETLEKRLVEYRDKTAPVAGYYEKRGLLKKVSAEQAPEKVVADVLQILN